MNGVSRDVLADLNVDYLLDKTEKIYTGRDHPVIYVGKGAETFDSGTVRWVRWILLELLLALINGTDNRF